jgi:hypothetical protein
MNDKSVDLFQRLRTIESWTKFFKPAIRLLYKVKTLSSGFAEIFLKYLVEALCHKPEGRGFDSS